MTAAFLNAGGLIGTRLLLAFVFDPFVGMDGFKDEIKSGGCFVDSGHHRCFQFYDCPSRNYLLRPRWDKMAGHIVYQRSAKTRTTIGV